MVSLLHHSKLSIKEIDDFIDDVGIVEDTSIFEAANEIVQQLQSTASFAFSDPADGEACTIYYMSGAVAHSVLHTTRCDDCKEILVDDESICVDVHHLKEQVFFNDVNRGALIKPSEYLFMTCIDCWKIFAGMKQSEAIMKNVLTSSNQKSLFCKIVDMLVIEDAIIIDNNYCVKSHDVKRMIAERFFNCLTKNFVKSVNENINGSSLSKKRKLTKLN
ncbi:hypothetical protein HELRODRAFT_169758 [Helobdella robusta]|uniref:Uncharacterized protein n=1 Tax=Helobdella robusta TaxID=6412 RepID=T1F2A8_HELRO|nr:hypothetical protein HELRODRAFT_169758 [Helobdella robusta]ESO08034.1 hypothetical protein HELRODRAFT_169758 [Helobdella robusta]